MIKHLVMTSLLASCVFASVARLTLVGDVGTLVVNTGNFSTDPSTAVGLTNDRYLAIRSVNVPSSFEDYSYNELAHAAILGLHQIVDDVESGERVITLVSPEFRRLSSHPYISGFSRITGYDVVIERPSDLEIWNRRDWVFGSFIMIPGTGDLILQVEGLDYVAGMHVAIVDAEPDSRFVIGVHLITSTVPGFVFCRDTHIIPDFLTLRTGLVTVSRASYDEVQRNCVTGYGRVNINAWDLHSGWNIRGLSLGVGCPGKIVQQDQTQSGTALDLRSQDLEFDGANVYNESYIVNSRAWVGTDDMSETPSSTTDVLFCVSACYLDSGSRLLRGAPGTNRTRHNFPAIPQDLTDPNENPWGDGGAF